MFCIPTKKNRQKISVWFHVAKIKKRWIKLKKRYSKNLHRIKQKTTNKERVSICFIGYADGASCDTFTNLYRLFKKDSGFDVSVIVLPYSHDSKENMIECLDKAVEYCRSIGVDAEPGYDKEKDEFINRHNQYDIVVFENAYDWVRPEFSVSNFPNALTFFIPYGQFLANNINYHFLQKMMSEFFCIYPTSKSVANMMKKYSLIDGQNINKEFLGNPKNQAFFDKKYKAKDVWKKQSKKKKRIIWAPHHLWARYSNFLKYKDVFIELAKEYENEIQIAFKPHPALKSSLKERAGWTNEQINDYYDLWNNMPNTQLEDGDWTDLFLCSNAMILDSVGFMAEYSFSGNPLCVLYNEDEKGNRIMKFSDCGEELFELIYRAKTKDECIDFIKNIVLENNDYQKVARDRYILENYLPPYGKTASENIYSDIKKKVQNG